MVERLIPRTVLACLLLAAGGMIPSTTYAQFGSPPRPAAGFKNSASFGLSYGVNNSRDADFWGWTTEYSRQVGDRWFAAGSIMWDRETEDFDTAPNVEVDTFTVAGTISCGLTERRAITTGLGKGFADTGECRARGD